MSVKCPADIFKQFEDGCGGYVDLSEEGKAFSYSALHDMTWLGDSATSFCVEIASSHKKLFLIYEDPESWGLGHGYQVRVIKSLDEL